MGQLPSGLLQPEAIGQVIDHAPCVIDVDRADAGALRLMYEFVGEQPVSFHEIGQGPRRVGRARPEGVGSSSTRECLGTKAGCRQQPHAVPHVRQIGQHQLREEPETFGNDQTVSRQPAQVIEDQVEALAVEPREAAVHAHWIAIDPALIHAHSAEALQQWRSSPVQQRAVDADHLVGAVDADIEALSQKVCDRRLPGATPAAHPPDMVKSRHATSVQVFAVNGPHYGTLIVWTVGILAIEPGASAPPTSRADHEQGAG